MGSRTSGAVAALMGISIAASASGQVLELAWSDAHELVSDRATVEREVSSLLAETGLEIVWREAPPEAATRAPLLEATVVVSPSDPSGPGWNLSPEAMGAYLKSERSGAIFVFYERVATVMGHSGDGLLEPSDSRALDRAVGRVVVHELVHRIAPSLPHAEVGVFRSSLGRAALSSRRLGLDEGSLLVLRSASAGTVPRTAQVEPRR